MQHFSSAQMGRLLTYSALADAIGAAVRDDSVTAPTRIHYRLGENAQDALLIMPAWGRSRLGIVKVVTVRSANAAQRLPTVQGIALVFNEQNGAPVATLDATALTRWRTAATSLLAARYLARPSSKVMLMVGSGAVANHLIRAYQSEFPLREVLIWSRTQAHARRLATTIASEVVRTTVVRDLESAVRRSDIVSCATMAEDGLVSGAWVREGTHVDLVGGFTPRMREVDDTLIKLAEIYVDTRAGALKEAGDLVQPLRAGIIAESDIRGELADLVRDASPVRCSDGSITVFKSVGHSIEDLAAAELVLAASSRGEDVSRET